MENCSDQTFALKNSEFLPTSIDSRVDYNRLKRELEAGYERPTKKGRMKLNVLPFANLVFFPTMDIKKTKQSVLERKERDKEKEKKTRHSKRAPKHVLMVDNDTKRKVNVIFCDFLFNRLLLKLVKDSISIFI